MDWFKNKFYKVNSYPDQKYPDFEAMFSESGENKIGLSLNKVLFKVLSLAVLSAGLLLLINLTLITFTDRGGSFWRFFRWSPKSNINFLYIVRPNCHYRNSATRTAFGPP